MDVAKKINHIPKIIPLEQVAMHYEKYKYEFTIKLAGLWRATIIWCEDYPRKSPQEMVEIISKFLN